MLALPLSLPLARPSGYEPLTDEPVFDLRAHLALEPPSKIWTLEDFGYDAAEIDACASKIAVAGPLRLLSQAGADAARSVALALKSASQTGERTAHYLTGGVYRSRFLRDFCSCPEVIAFLSKVAGCDLLPHSMPSQQVYINYAPEDITRAVDTWHADSIGLDAVIMLTDPASFSGGEFQFFQGTAHEAASLLESSTENLTAATSRDLPADRVRSIPFPGAGYAVFQQGAKVIHRATRLTRRAERISMVIGQVARNVGLPDPTRDSIVGWQESGIVAEFARHKAWLSCTKLEHLLSHIDLNAPPTEIGAMLEGAIADAQRAVAIISDACGGA